jgi:hypothetical protein
VCPGFEGRRARYVYATLGAAGLPGGGAAPPVPTQSFVVVDLERGGGGGVGGGAEREAWIVAPVFDGATRTTSYVVLDAADLAAGPVCELPLPTHIPWGLHGTWVEPGGGAVL